MTQKEQLLNKWNSEMKVIQEKKWNNVKKVRYKQNCADSIYFAQMKIYLQCIEDLKNSELK